MICTEINNLLLSQTFGVAQYLSDALQCGEVVWRYGLLKKGYGLCHGAAGNAYTFLALYRQTQEAKHLYRACMVRVRVKFDLNFSLPDSSYSIFSKSYSYIMISYIKVAVPLEF